MMRVTLSLLLCCLPIVGQFRNRGRPQPSEVVLRCGSEIPWRTGLDEALRDAAAERRPVFWYVPTLDRSRVDRKDVVDLYMMSGPFCSPEVATLLERKFIPLKQAANRDLCQRFGLRFLDFVEPGFLVLDPEGKELARVDRITTFSNEWFLHRLHGVLEQKGELARDSKPVAVARAQSENRLALATALCDEGDFTAAFQALGKTEPQSDQERYLRGRIQSGRHILAAALNLLEPVSAKSGPLQGPALCELGRVWFDSEEPELATEALKKAARLDHARRDEARFFLGMIRFVTGDKGDARKEWKKLAAARPASRWSRKAAAELEGFGPFARGFERFQPLPEQAWRSPDTGTRLPCDPEDLPFLARESVAHLVRMQGDDGCWRDSNYDFGGQDSLPNVYAAVSALAANALLDWRDVDPEAVDAAVRKAFAYLARDQNLAWKDKDEILWAHTYRILFFERLARSSHPLASKARAAIKPLVRHLAESQAKNGAWRHEYSNPFATATALHALSVAREAGVATGKETVNRGAEALLRCRGQDGTFSYGMRRRGGGRIEGAAGRMPLCELALLLSGKSDQEKLATAVEAGFAHHELLERVRKVDDHADRFANGGFFFWYDMHGRVQAIRAIEDPKLRQSCISRQRTLILEIPEIDGTFQESHETGRVYATAMALICLRALQDGLP